MEDQRGVHGGKRTQTDTAPCRIEAGIIYYFCVVMQSDLWLKVKTARPSAARGGMCDQSMRSMACGCEEMGCEVHGGEALGGSGKR